MLCREIIAVCSQIDTKRINMLCGLETEFVFVVHKVTTGIWNPLVAILNQQTSNLLYLTHNTTAVKQYISAHRVVCVWQFIICTPLIKTILSVCPLFDVNSFPTTATILVAL